MKFDINRMAKLAGFADGESRVLAEAGNRSYHEDPALASEKELQFKGQLNETDSEDDELEEMADVEELGEGDELTEDDEDVVLEIDEDMLREEINKMRVERARKLNESKARSVIRAELKEIFDSLGLGDSSWLYGDNPPKNSKDGQVTVSFPGIGFKTK